jgi:hypothetical protein
VRALWRIWAEDGRFSRLSRKAGWIRCCILSVPYDFRDSMRMERALVEHIRRALYMAILPFDVLLLRDQDRKVRGRRRCKVKLTSTSYDKTARADNCRLRRISKCSLSSLCYRNDHMIFGLLYPCIRIWSVSQLMCRVAPCMQNKSTTRITHRYCREGLVTRSCQSAVLSQQITTAYLR